MKHFGAEAAHTALSLEKKAEHWAEEKWEDRKHKAEEQRLIQQIRDQDLQTKLCVRATWIPFDLNLTLARSLPTEIPEGAVTCCLFVGIYQADSLLRNERLLVGSSKAVAAAADEVFWVKVGCTPALGLNGRETHDEGVDQITSFTTKKLAPPERIAEESHLDRQDEGEDSDPEAGATKESRQAERRLDLARKISVMLNLGNPIEVIADVLDIPVAMVESFLEAAAQNEVHDMETAVEWSEAFIFLLRDPRQAVVNLEVMRNVDESLGELSYHVGNLLTSPKLTEEQHRRQLRGKGAHQQHRARLSVRFQLRMASPGNVSTGQPLTQSSTAGAEAAAGLKSFFAEDTLELQAIRDEEIRQTSGFSESSWWEYLSRGYQLRKATVPPWLTF